MSRRTIFWIALGVVLFHAGLFYLLNRMSGPAPTRHAPTPTFGFSEETYRDAATGEKITYRELRVSTQLADPALLRKLDAQRAHASPAPATTPAPSPQ